MTEYEEYEDENEEETMTVYCSICNQEIGDIVELEDLDTLPDLALWSGSEIGDPVGGTYICMGCVDYAYELRYGEPLKKRVKRWLRHRGWTIRRIRRILRWR
jgi:hypothetical protein